MIVHVKLDDRLSILRAGDRFHRWNSLDDQRVCRICERKFKGRQVEIRRLAGGRYKLCCPTLGCPSAPHQWLYPQAPIVSEIAEPNCWRAGGQPARRQWRQCRRHAVTGCDWVTLDQSKAFPALHGALIVSSIFWEPREDETNHNNV
jgi:hypothetical protein